MDSTTVGLIGAYAVFIGTTVMFFKFVGKRRREGDKIGRERK